ncbi:MAG: hypothetical protein H6563_13320 [Lewinellaceae bacterium]|nr:hypothetical protein [Lewinellaceae bacterium]
MRTTFLLTIFFISLNTCLFSQNGASSDALKVYLDCSWFCDMDFVRREVDYVDYVRDQFLANVYVLATEQSTGGNGREIKLMFQGQGAFQGVQDTLIFYRTVNDSEDEFRQRLVRYLSAGLMPYLARTSRFEHVVITYEKPEGTRGEDQSSNTAEADDPWNFWVFRTSISGYMNGDNIYRSRSFYGELEASRITEKWKHYASFSGNASNDIFEFQDDNGEMLRFENPNHSFNAHIYTVKSLTDHWSAGAEIKAFRSTFGNYNYAAKARTAVEYNVFPYQQSNQRRLAFQYFIGTQYNDYLETTIYERDRELLFEQEVNAGLTLVQKWGDIYASLSWENYLHNFKFNSLDGYIETEVRLFKGFSFNVGAGASIIHNQLNIQKGDVSESDVLIRRRQLETSFDYWMHFGVSYTFGSVYNNVVNPRFGD